MIWPLLRGGATPSGVWPPVPTRDQVCGVQLTFAGLVVETKQYGVQPWFEPAYQTLTDPEDRAWARRQKKAAGDTHLILEFFTNMQRLYDEPGQPWQDAITPSGENDPTWFLGLVEEVIQDGLIPIVAFDGDDGSRGHANAMRQLPVLADLMKSSAHGDLSPYILYARLWDGVFYGSTPDEIAEFGRAFRRLVPDGYLAIEHQPGRIPTGEGDADWIHGGAMTTYDVLLSEFNFPPPNDTIWQIAGRTIRPYHRPPDQPVGDDPNPPFYLRDGNPRGPYFVCAFEWWALYNWVRIGWPHFVATSPVVVAFQQQIVQERAYLKSVGYRYTG